MKILITGGLGYIGSWLYLLLPDHDIDILDENLYNSKIKLNTFQQNIGEFEPKWYYDAVIHLADYRLQDYNRQLVHTNIGNNERFLNQIKTDYLVYASSCSVYGFQTEICDENSIPNPTSYYAESKLKIEEHISWLPNSCVLRFGTAYGKSSTTRDDLLINAMIKAVKDQKEFDIYSMEAIRPYINVRDIAAGIKFAVQNKLTGLYNMSHQNLTVREVIQHFPKTDVFKSKPELAAFNEDKRNYAVTSDKINQAGFYPSIELRNELN